jgi:hypothetical protein
VDDDFSRLCGALNRQKTLDHRFFLCAGLAGVDLNNLILVVALEEFF